MSEAEVADDPEADKSPYLMTLSLGVIDHLGLNLYSNIPAVLSELVANAWDADSPVVKVDIDTESKTITLADEGCGMSVDDVNNRFLKVGYRRRENGETETPSGRHVMGRKGIGKLSIFSIAEEVEIHTRNENAAACGLTMRVDAIRAAMGKDGTGNYAPEAIPAEEITVERGTKLVLRKLKKRVTQATDQALRKRLARRFSILGNEHGFDVFINGQQVGVEDRDYFKHLQYFWSFGDGAEAMQALATKATKKETFSGTVNAAQVLTAEERKELGVPEEPTKAPTYEVSGWLGTFDAQASIDEGNNSIVVMAWGKLIHEDLLKEIKAGGLFTKYVIGMVRADFLDADDSEDIVTSNRQSLREDDLRALLLRRWVERVALATVGRNWRDWRRDDSLTRARKNTAVEEWYTQLSGTNKTFAKKLFGKIGALAVEDDEARRELYRHAILGFERLQLRDKLDEIEALPDGPGAAQFLPLLQTVDDLEAVHYFEIARGRLEVIRSFENIIDENEKEQVVRDFLFDHLWLLDPSWERGAMPEARMEKAIKKIFDDDTASLSKEEQDARLDIQLRTAAGKFVIVELKRYSVRPKAFTLLEQVRKYRMAVRKCLDDKFQDARPVETILVLGQSPNDLPVEEFERHLGLLNARWIGYDQLINGAQAAYREYTDADEKTSRIVKLLGKI